MSASTRGGRAIPVESNPVVALAGMQLGLGLTVAAIAIVVISAREAFHLLDFLPRLVRLVAAALGPVTIHILIFHHQAPGFWAWLTTALFDDALPNEWSWARDHLAATLPSGTWLLTGGMGVTAVLALARRIPQLADSTSDQPKRPEM